MKRVLRYSIHCLLLVLCAGLLIFANETLAANGQTANQKTSNERYITIDFDNVEINLLIKYISELTGKNFIVDPAVRGNVTIISPTKISENDAYLVFESVLEIHGFTTVPSGSVIKIVPSAEARSRSIDTIRPGTATEPEDRVVTQLVPLKYTTPVEMQKVLQPLVSKTSVVIPHTQSGMLIITETLSNIKRLMSIIETLDVEYSREEVAVVPLNFGNANKLSTILNTIFQKSAGAPAAKGGVAKSLIKVVPYERINTLVILAEPADVARVKRLVDKLDTEAERGEGNIHVFYLQNATASELAKVLNALPEQQTEKEQGDGKEPAISKNVNIMADEETNALIITASRSEYTVMEEVIKKLDIPRRMVYLEALIMEVSTDMTFDVGVQWLAGGTFDDGTGRLATGFSGESGYDLLGNITDPDNPSLPRGFSFGVIKEGIEIGGVTFPNIAAILKAYKKDENINIISTPQILTTDNKKAEISVGENIPFITSQNTTASEQDYTQYEYRDVATKLMITPHISQANTLRLEIETEVTRLKGTESLTPSTFKRTAATTVIVNDKDSVVIGGIIGQDASEGEWKIPLLGDIPILGWLFKTHATNSRKTNMFIFVTPHIIRNPADIAAVTLRKEEELGNVMPQVEEQLHQEINPEHSVKLADIGYEKLSGGQNLAAKEYFMESLEIDPNNPFALINLGVLFEKEQAYPQAIQMYQRVIDTGTYEVARSPEGQEGIDISLVQIARENIVHVKKMMQKQ
jgi:general secretion pathway protein D